MGNNVVLALMQPYFFPYMGYFDLINNCNKFVVFDQAQYIKQGWINRNRVLHPIEGWQYVTVPMEKHKSSAQICQVSMASNDSWKPKVIARLTHLKSHAPHYSSTMQLVKDCLSSEEREISRFNVAILEKICRYLELELDYDYLSEMDLNLGEDLKPGEWALELAIKLGAKKYVNLPGGESLFDRMAFEQNKIKLCVRKAAQFSYSTGKYQYQSNLSIIDALMWNSVKDIQQYLHYQANNTIQVAQQ